jgi:hypothetical protein
MSTAARHAIWRRLDGPGLEFACVEPLHDGWRLSGAASFEHHGGPALLRYTVECDRAWRTRYAWVDGRVDGATVRHGVELLASGRWWLDGRELPEFDGCVDVDLNFSPITNMLPIRRLSLALGESAVVNAAWLRFPSFTLEKLQQVYRRTGPRSYHYESAGGTFHAELTVDGGGLVQDYPPLWARARTSER